MSQAFKSNYFQDESASGSSTYVNTGDIVDNDIHLNDTKVFELNNGVLSTTLNSDNNTSAFSVKNLSGTELIKTTGNGVTSINKIKKISIDDALSNSDAMFNSDNTVNIGDNNDLGLWHNTDSYISNSQGKLNIVQKHISSDIVIDNQSLLGDTVFKLGSTNSNTKFKFTNSVGTNLFEISANGSNSITDNIPPSYTTIYQSNSYAIPSAPSNNTTGANYNINIGTGALSSLTNGFQNVAIGFDTLKSVTTNDYSVAIGSRSGEFPASQYNTFIGAFSGRGSENVSTGGTNTGVGGLSLNEIESGNNNTACGYSAGNSITTGIHNTIIGTSAGNELIQSDFCVGIGSSSLRNVTTNDDNVICIGYNSGAGLTIASHDFIIGSHNSISRQLIHANCDNANRNFSPAQDDSINLGKSDKRWDTIYASSSTIQTSDRNLKENITYMNSSDSLAFINDLKPCKFSFIGKSRYHSGLIAQDVYQAMIDNNLNPDTHALYCKDTINDTVIEDELDDNGDPIYLDDGTKKQKLKQLHTTSERLGLRYENLISHLISAVQEINSKYISLEARITALEVNI